MIIVENIKKFFAESEVIKQNGKYITVDGVKDDFDNCSIQLTGITPQLAEDCLGMKYVAEWEVNFNLFVYSNIEGQNEVLENNRFTQDLSLWIINQNMHNKLPIVMDGVETVLLKASNFGLYEKYENGNCIYLIQCSMILK